MRAGEENLRAALLAADVVDIGADAVAIAVHFARDQLVAADDGFTAAEVDDDVAIFDALDGAVDDLADTIDVFVIHALALGIAHLLDDHLLGRLGSDAAELDGRQWLADEVADLGIGIALYGIGQCDLLGGLFDRLDHFAQAGELELAGARVDLGTDLGFGAVAGLGRLLDGILHGCDHDHAVDRLLAGDRIGDLQQFKSVRANGHYSISSGRSSLISTVSISSSSSMGFSD